MTAWLAAHPAESADCLTLQLDGDEQQRTLVLITRDGRSARRTLDADDELEETIDALLLAPPPPPRPALPEPAAAAPPTAPPLPDPPRAPQPPAKRALPEQHLFAAAGGRWHPEPGMGLWQAETGWSWRPTAAVFEAGARLSPALTPGGLPAAGYTASATGVWAMLGLPLSVTPRWRLDAGATAGWQRFVETADNPVAAKKNDLDLSSDQWLSGAALLATAPLSAHLSVRALLDTTWTLSGLRTKGATSKDIPALPSFGLGLSLGIEVNP